MTAGLGALAAAAPVRSKAAPGPGPTPEALLRALDVTVGRHKAGDPFLRSALCDQAQDAAHGEVPELSVAP